MVFYWNISPKLDKNSSKSGEAVFFSTLSVIRSPSFLLDKVNASVTVATEYGSKFLLSESNSSSMILSAKADKILSKKDSSFCSSSEVSFYKLV